MTFEGVAFTALWITGVAAGGCGAATGTLAAGGVEWGCEVVVAGPVVSPGLLPHPVPPLGTKLTAGSLPLCSLFKLGKFAGGRRAEGTFPKHCMPCLRGSVLFCWDGSNDSPLYKLFISSD